MKKFSDRDRYGAFAHRKVVPLRRARLRRPRNLSTLLVAACVLGFASPFAVSFVRDWFQSADGPTPSMYSRPVGASASDSYVRGPIPLCVGWSRFRSTCLVDGDTGWERGVKWRLLDVDTPELSNPGCADELRKALAARDRLQELMSSDYRIDWLGTADRYGRQLVRVRLADGRDAGRVLLQEGLAQRWPNSGNVWCGR